jgi:tetratricopeptide (TPR) repeat protein
VGALRRALALTIVVTATATTLAHAQQGADRATGFERLASPDEQRVRELLRQARRLEVEARSVLPMDLRGLCLRALSRQDTAESLAIVRGASRAVRALGRPALRRLALIESALDRLSLARHRAPDDAEITRATARLLVAWEEPGEPYSCTTRRRDAEAVAMLTTLRSDAPQLAPEETGFELAIALTREQRFAEAARAWTDVSALVGAGGERAVTVRTNLAETTMLAGDVEAAVGHYRRALAVAAAGRSYQQALWGLAVALDRLGEHAEALSHVEKALHAEGWAQRVLRSDGVFFEPEHELHYYEALGNEVLAEREEASDRQGLLAAAATSYRAFLRGDGGHGPFADTAEANLARVTAALLAARREKRPTKTKRPDAGLKQRR